MFSLGLLKRLYLITYLLQKGCLKGYFFYLEGLHSATPITLPVVAKPFLSFPALPTLISHILTPQLLRHLSTECEFPSARRYQHVSVDCVCNTGALGKRQTQSCLVTDTIFPQFWAHGILSIMQPGGFTEAYLPFTTHQEDKQPFKRHRSSHTEIVISKSQPSPSLSILLVLRQTSHKRCSCFC